MLGLYLDNSLIDVYLLTQLAIIAKEEYAKAYPRSKVELKKVMKDGIYHEELEDNYV